MGAWAPEKYHVGPLLVAEASNNCDQNYKNEVGLYFDITKLKLWEIDCARRLPKEKY